MKSKFSYDFNFKKGCFTINIGRKLPRVRVQLFSEYNRTYKEANVSYTIEDIIKRIRNTFPYEFEYYDANSAFVLNV